MRTMWCMAAFVLSLATTTEAHAAARAFVQPDRIALGQTTTLNVEVDSAFGEPPDFSVLADNFELGQQSSSSRTQIANGSASVRSIYAIVLEPKEAGVITIPALKVGDETTQPVQVTVLEEEPGSAEAGSPIFIESEISTAEPYVQQPVMYTVRLVFLMPIRNGDLRVRPPDNASVQQIGEDKTYRQERNGLPYTVFERRFVLRPEQSGTIELPAPQFRGVASSRGIDPFFDRGQSVSAVGERRTLTVKPRPDDAPQPWLPADELRLTRGAVSDDARTGEPLMLEVTLAADGATAAQLPELELPAIPGTQVFPEPPQTKDDTASGAIRSSVTRRFAIVPTRTGTLTLPELTIPYWNTKTDRADVAKLPSLTLDVTAGNAAAAPNIAPADTTVAAPAPTATPANVATDAGSVRLWQSIAAAFALAFVAALVWGWRRGAVRAVPVPTAPHAPAPLQPAAIRRALAGGDLREIADALRAASSPASPNLGALKSRLADKSQRNAIDALEHALWAPGVTPAEHEATRAKLRSAFKDGPKFARTNGVGREPVLPTLYPER